MNEPTRTSRFTWVADALRKPSYVILVSLFGLFAGGVLVAGLVALLLTPTLPAIDGLAERQLKVPMRVYTEDGVLIAEFGEEKRIPVKSAEVPELLKKAILAAEDDSFYFHQGVDFLGIARATLSNLRAGRHAEGASTITMQVARNFFLSPEKTYTRKLREILLAFKIERELSKDQILELYMNKIFLGNRAYGFGAAAQIYFGKALPQLTLAETALLAGLPKAPSRDNPISNPDSARVRRDYVLGRMHKLGYIDDPAYEEARSGPVTASQHTFKSAFEAPYVAEMVRQHMFQTYDEKTYGGGFHVYTTIRSGNQQAAETALRNGLREYDQRHGYRGPVGEEKIGGTLDNGRLDDILKDYQAVADLVPAVVTGLEDKTVQAYTQNGETAIIGWDGLAWARPYIDENTVGPPPRVAADVVRPGHIVYLRRTAENAWVLSQAPAVAGALVSIRPSDGAVLALSGGFDFYESSFNRVIQAERQAGSSLKPFIYSAALERGFTAASLISGAPIVIEDVNLEDEWRPEDYSRKFFGETRLRKALTLSLNLVSVRLLRAIGPEYAIDYLTRFGFDRRQLPRNLSLALGTASVTPLQLTTAFSVFANGGHKVEPYFISRIEDSEGNVIFQANPARACPDCRAPATDTKTTTGDGPAAGAPPAPVAAPQVITPENRFIMTSILRDVATFGTGKMAAELGRKDIAGKTGTTNEYRDAWFCGFNDDVVTTAWVGFDQPAPLGAGEVGGRAALPIWLDYMRVALAGVPERPLLQPERVVSTSVHSETGRPVDPTDPNAINEYFIEGTLPQTAESNSTMPAPAPESVREGLF